MMSIQLSVSLMPPPQITCFYGTVAAGHGLTPPAYRGEHLTQSSQCRSCSLSEFFFFYQTENVSLKPEIVTSQRMVGTESTKSYRCRANCSFKLYVYWWVSVVPLMMGFNEILPHKNSFTWGKTKHTQIHKHIYTFVIDLHIYIHSSWVISIFPLILSSSSKSIASGRYL